MIVVFNCKTLKHLLKFYFCLVCKLNKQLERCYWHLRFNKSLDSYKNRFITIAIDSLLSLFIYKQKVKHKTAEYD